MAALATGAKRQFETKLDFQKASHSMCGDALSLAGYEQESLMLQVQPPYSQGETSRCWGPGRQGEETGSLMPSTKAGVSSG